MTSAPISDIELRPSGGTALIEKNTELTSPLLCPEIRLHLITERCALWRARENEAAAIGLPEPYWAFSWAGGQALARYLLDHPETVRGKRVMDFGAGGGVEAIAAAKSGAIDVLAADIDPMAATAVEMNASTNGVTVRTTRQNLIGRDDPRWQVVLAGDVFYDRVFAQTALRWLQGLANKGKVVFISDPARGFVRLDGMRKLASYLAPSDIGDDHLVDTGVYLVPGPA